jgi:CYTH domain-containing protein
MRKEIELKFEVTPRDLRKLRAARVLRRKPLKEENLVSVYFDTPKHTLARNEVTLRVRHNGAKRLQTIKSGGLASSFRRGEWEHEIKRDVPNLRKARDTALEPLLTKKLKRRLKPVFETHIHRTSVPVRKNGTRIEVALDEGQVRAGRRSAPISELELELKRGEPGDIFKLAQEMGKLAPATLSLKSKSERGYDLIENKPAKAVGAEKIRVRRGMSTTDAFRTIGRSILRHIAGNETAVRRSDSEGVHQMRGRPAPPTRGHIAVLEPAWRPGDRGGEGRAEMADRRTSARPRPRCLHEKRDRTVTSRDADEAWNEGTNRRPDIATRGSLRQGKGRGRVAALSFASTPHAAMAGKWRLGQASAVLWTSTHRTFRRGYSRAAY